MRTFYFKDIEELCLDAMDVYNGYNKILFVCKYEDAREILRELVYYDHEFKYLNLEDYEGKGYEDEFYISINEDGILCEKAKSQKDGTYLYTDADLVYISSDSSSKILSKLNDDAIVYEYSFNEDENSEEYDDFCEYYYDRKEDKCFLDDESELKEGEINVSPIKENDKVHGFNLSTYDDGAYRSYSYYSSDVLDEDTVRKILKDLNF